MKSRFGAHELMSTVNTQCRQEGKSPINHQASQNPCLRGIGHHHHYHHHHFIIFIMLWSSLWCLFQRILILDILLLAMKSEQPLYEQNREKVTIQGR